MLGWTLILQEVTFTTTKKEKNILNINYICRKDTSLTQTHLWTINNAKPTNTHYFKSSDGGAIFTVEILAYTSFQFNVFDMFSRLGFCLSAPSCAWSLPFVYSFWSAQDVFPVWGMYSILKWINECTTIVDRWPLLSYRVWNHMWTPGYQKLIFDFCTNCLASTRTKWHSV